MKKPDFVSIDSPQLPNQTPSIKPLLMSKKMLRVLAAVVLLGFSAEASTHSFKFDGPTDPTTDGTLAVFRAGDNADLSALAGVWIATNGSTLETGVANQ